MAHKHSCQNCVQVEKPNSATAVVATLSAVTRPVPRRVLSRSLARLDTMVPAEITIDTPPCQATPRAQLRVHTGPRRTQQRVRQAQANEGQIDDGQKQRNHSKYPLTFCDCDTMIISSNGGK